MKRLFLAALAALIAGLPAADAALAKSPTIRLDRDAICALFEQAGHKECPDYEIVRSNKSGDVLVPAILSGSLSSVEVTRDSDRPTGPVTVPIER